MSTTLDARRPRPVSAMDTAPERKRAVVCHPQLLMAEALAQSVTEAGAVGVTEAVTDVDQALAATKHTVDLVVVADICDEDVSALVEALRHRHVRSPVITAYTQPTLDAVVSALEAGASGVLDLSDPPSVIASGIRSTLLNGTYVPRRMQVAVVHALARRRADRTRYQHRLAILTPRERQILDLLADGLARVEIAARLELSPHTVRTHIDRVKAKLGVASQQQAVSAVRRYVTISPPQTETPQAGAAQTDRST